MPRWSERGLAHSHDVGIQSILMPDLDFKVRFPPALPTSIKVMRHRGLNKEMG